MFLRRRGFLRITSKQDMIFWNTKHAKNCKTVLMCKERLFWTGWHNCGFFLASRSHPISFPIIPSYHKEKVRDWIEGESDELEGEGEPDGLSLRLPPHLPCPRSSASARADVITRKRDCGHCLTLSDGFSDWNYGQMRPTCPPPKRNSLCANWGSKLNFRRDPWSVQIGAAAKSLGLKILPL